MGKLLRRLLVGAIAVAGVAALSVPDVAVAEPIGISKTADLKFATIAPDDVNPGTATISPAGTRTCDAPLTCFGGPVSAAAFSVTGDASAIYVITLPGSSSVTSGGNSMTVDTFDDSKGGVGQLSGGADSFTVGARLNIGAGQVPGAYAGTFTVTVEYQ